MNKQQAKILIILNQCDDKNRKVAYTCIECKEIKPFIGEKTKHCIDCLDWKMSDLRNGADLRRANLRGSMKATKKGYSSKKNVF